MSNTFQLNIVTPDRAFFSGAVESLVINTPDGEMGILCHALPMVTVLKSGILRICQDGRWMEAVNSDGFVSIMRDKVTVLSQSCEWPYEIDIQRVDQEITVLHDKEKKAKSVYEYKMAKAQLAAQFAKLRIKRPIDD